MAEQQRRVRVARAVREDALSYDDYSVVDCDGHVVEWIPDMAEYMSDRIKGQALNPARNRQGVFPSIDGMHFALRAGTMDSERVTASEYMPGSGEDWVAFLEQAGIDKSVLFSTEGLSVGPHPNTPVCGRGLPSLQRLHLREICQGERPAAAGGAPAHAGRSGGREGAPARGGKARLCRRHAAVHGTAAPPGPPELLAGLCGSRAPGGADSDSRRLQPGRRNGHVYELHRFPRPASFGSVDDRSRVVHLPRRVRRTPEAQGGVHGGRLWLARFSRRPHGA